MAMAQEVTLSRLTHDVVQNTYKEVHALLDSLSELDPEDRRAKLLEALLKIRHRFARLLVAVRWFMSYSAFHGTAQVARNCSLHRRGAMQDNADILWSVSQFVKGAAAFSPALCQASEVLGASAFFARMPRVIETWVGLDVSSDVHALRDTEKDSLASSAEVTAEAVPRLRAITRHVVSSALPSGVVIMSSGRESQDASTRIGIPDAWTCDVVLDTLKPEAAFFKLLHYDVIVDGHPDTPGVFRNPFRDEEGSFRLGPHRERLRMEAEARMAFETRDAFESGSNDKRLPNALHSLIKMMSYEVAGKLALDVARSQALAFLKHGVWKSMGVSLSGVGSEAADDRPVQIVYWGKSHMKATFSIIMRSQESLETWDGTILHVEHKPSLKRKGLPSALSLGSVNVEAALLETCRIRAAHELERLKDLCIPECPDRVSARVVKSGSWCTHLAFSFEGHGVAVRFRCSSRSGGFSLHLHGIARLASQGHDSIAEDLRRNMWNGERFFPKGLTDMKKIVIPIVCNAFGAVRNRAALQKGYAIGAGAIPRWPPGIDTVTAPEKTASGKRVRPPLMPVDNGQPERFLTLLSVATEDDKVLVKPESTPSKRARSLPMQFSLSPSGVAFMEGRRPEGVQIPAWVHPLQCSANQMADWAEIRHAVIVRMRRDNILRRLEEKGLALALDCDYSLRSPHFSRLKMKKTPLDVASAALRLMNNDAWQMQLTLTTDIFDQDYVLGQVVSYTSSRRLLTFTYPTFTRNVLGTFSQDFRRAGTLATMLKALSPQTKLYSLERRLPSSIQVRVQKTLLSIGVCGGSRIKIEAKPHSPTLSDHLIPLMEEVLQASDKDIGQSLSQMLELSIPAAVLLSYILSKAPANSRVKFFSVLRARLMIQFKDQKRPYALDLDFRNPGRVLLSDFHRVAAVYKNAAASQFSPIPNWENATRAMEAKKMGARGHGGATYVLPIGALGQTVVNIYKASLRRQNSS